jgi:hypothetical protein
MNLNGACCIESIELFSEPSLILNKNKKIENFNKAFEENFSVNKHGLFGSEFAGIEIIKENFDLFNRENNLANEKANTQKVLKQK